MRSTHQHFVIRRKSSLTTGSFTVLAAFLFLNETAPAARGQQWSTSGNDIYNANSGNVGIGTTSPATTLDVNGTLKATGGAVSAGSYGVQVLGAAGSVDRDILLAGAAGLSNGLTVQRVGGEMRYVFNDGKVGIGTTSPGARLHVDGSGASTAILAYRGDLGGSYSHILYGTTGDWFIRSSLGTGKVVLQDSGGYVGIGNSSPQTPLAVHVGTDLNLEFDSASGAGRISVVNDARNSNPNLRLQASSYSFYGNAGAGPYLTINSSGDLTVSGNISAKFQDIAEWVPSSVSINAGTVVVLDADKVNHVVPSLIAYDTRVAGVVSAAPGIILGEASSDKIKVATTGRVKVRVDASHAPIGVGDLLVTSDKTGMAMKSEPVNLGGIELHRPGTLIGKALEPLTGGEGEILVLLSLQ